MFMGISLEFPGALRCCLRYPFKFQHLLALAWTVAAAFRPSGAQFPEFGRLYALSQISLLYSPPPCICSRLRNV
ncbi:hypothetical protein BC567DRAFT_217097 [Phyllosticta citribraziliensis]